MAGQRVEEVGHQLAVGEVKIVVLCGPTLLRY